MCSRARFLDSSLEVCAGSSVFVPAGVAHSYFEAHGPTRYLIVMTPRLRELIDELHAAPFDQHSEIMKRFDSEILE
jgi:mannose-6-phosphate isomerase-like protein (cupin superfamily)